MEDSRKGKKSGKKELQRLSHMWVGVNGKETIVYNTKEGKKEGGTEKKTKEKREKEKEKKEKT